MELSAFGLLILLSHVSVHLSSSQNSDIYHRHKRHTDTAVVGLHASLLLKSPGFPKCCQPFTFLIEFGGREGTGYIRLLFDDLDLPKSSSLQIHDGPNSTSPAFLEQPRYDGGSWTRPVIAATSKYVFLKFIPGPTKGKTFVGFKASYWTVQSKPSAWTLDKHFTNPNAKCKDTCITVCPHLGDPMDGGQVNLQTLKISDNIKYSFDCVWQIKSPQKKTTFGVYARVVNMNLQHGRAEIRDDIHSDAEELVIFSDVEASNEANMAKLNQPWMGYTSQRGLYIRVTKPIDKGHFNFVYGVFQETGLSVMSCEFTFQDQELPGFKCAEINWCIPKQHLCNSVPNCPHGSDEDASLCKKMKEEDKDRDPNGVQVKPMPPTGECSYDQQECPDKTCVAKYYGKCEPGDCDSSSEKACETGQCVQKFERCPEESCPAYKKNSCDSGWVCYYDTDKCDGYPDCQDGRDEKFCTKEGFKWWYLLFLIIFPIGLIILLIRFCIRKCRNNKYKRRYENGQISFFGTTMEPVMTPVRGNGSMSVPSYSSRCHSPTSDHSNVTYQPITCTNYHPYSNQNGTAGFLEHLRRNSDQYRKEIEQYRREHEKLQDGRSKRSSNMDELLRGDHHHHHHHHRCCHVDHHDNLTPMHSSSRGNHVAHHHHHHHHNHHHSTSSHNLQRDGSRRQSRASMCSSHSNVTSELPVGSNGTGTSSHQSMHSSEPSRTSGMPDEDKELQVLRETCCQVVPHQHGHGHHGHRTSSHHDSGMLGPSAVVCTDDTCHLTVFSSPRGSRRGSREILQPEIHHNNIGHSRNSLQVESRHKEEDQHSIYSLSASDTDEDDEEEDSIYTPRTSRAHSMRSRRSRTSTSMLSARSGRTDRSKSFCVSSVCGSDYSHPTSQKRKGTVSDLSIPVPNGHHHGPISPSLSPSNRTSPTYKRCRSPSLLDPVFPSPAPPPYSETLFKERFHLSTESLPDKSKEEEHHHDAVPDLFRKQTTTDPGAAAGGAETMPITIGGGGGGGKGRRGRKAKTGLSAMLLGVNTMYDTSSSSYEDDDDE